jgi:hypothetical protein
MILTSTCALQVMRETASPFLTTNARSQELAGLSFDKFVVNGECLLAFRNKRLLLMLSNSAHMSYLQACCQTQGICQAVGGGVAGVLGMSHVIVGLDG